jgi:hypothetical protein
MKKILITYNILLAVFCLTACKKEFLDPKPLSIYSPENTFKTPDALLSVLANCENSMRFEMFTTNGPIITELIFSEVAIFGKTDAASPAQNMNLSITPDAQLNNGSYNRIGWYWDQGYIDIKNANTVISRINEPVYKSEAEKNAILGAAYFHRAYIYYRLCNQFGDVPLILTEIQGPKVDFYSTKREVILKKMKEDLEFAELWVTDNVDKGAATKGAVSHLLTKVNLSLGLFDDAIKSANNILNGSKYRLMTSRFGIDKANASKNITWDLHRPENKAIGENTEALMLTIDRMNTVGEYPLGTGMMYTAIPSWHNGIVTPNGNAGSANTAGIEIDQSTKYGSGAAQARGTWYSTHMIWKNGGGDYRHTPGNWMTMEELLYNNPAIKGKDAYYGMPMQLYSNGKILCTDTIRSWFDWPHYKLYIADPQRLPYRGGHSDWYVFRVAETYLLRAEAYYWKGDLINAAIDINKVRSRANAPDISASEANIGTILDERNRELFFEEPRKTELTRIAYIFAQTGKPAYNGKSYSLANFSDNNFWYDRIMEKTDFYNKGVKTKYGNEFKISPYHVLWPIPASSINANTQGTINQNKGYSGYEKNVPPLAAIPN